jgi:hypothetical protein
MTWLRLYKKRILTLDGKKLRTKLINNLLMGSSPERKAQTDKLNLNRKAIKVYKL